MGILLAVALPLAGADLIAKWVVPTPTWAYHERSLAWVVVCCVLLAGLVALTRVPSPLVAPTAGLLAAGTIGNTLSAIANDLVVPNPFVLEGDRAVVAFNLADVWVLAGIVSLVLVLSTWLIRNRSRLAPAATKEAAKDDAMTDDGRAAF